MTDTLSPDETSIVGGYTIIDGRRQPSESWQRIRRLRKSGLTLVCTSVDGWSALYLDVEHHRLWSLTFPEAGVHGGGPPALNAISEDEALAAFPSFDPVDLLADGGALAVKKPD